MAKNIKTDKNTSVRYNSSKLPGTLKNNLNLVKQFKNCNKDRKKYRTKNISSL